jgi:hypothetical protein
LQNEDEKPDVYTKLLNRLPPGHYSTLKYLVLHLNTITKLSAENLMTPGNIGVVFGPTLMRPEIVIPLIDISESGTKSHCIEYIVRNYDMLFGGDCDTESIAESVGPGHARKKSQMTVNESVGGLGGIESSIEIVAGGEDLERESV